MGSLSLIRISSVLLAVFVVTGLSFPRPDEGAYKIPAVGTGQRSQYYVLHSDGTFKYGFDSGDGAFESVKSHTVGNRDGNFGYVDPDGNSIRLEYEAGHGGFVARGDHLPKPSPELAQALAAVVRSSTPFVDPLASGDGDASYGFQFQSEDHSRNEQSDADGTVTGSYSYVDENGVTRSFTYRAGKGIGFVIEGDGLTQDVQSTSSQHQSSFRGTQQQHHSQTRGAQSHSTHGSSVVAGHRSQTPSRPFGAAVRSSSTNTYGGQQANIASTRSQTPGDASYSFSYDAGDHSRSENSDPNLNVDGSFSFVADDGNQRTISYVAGSSTGFQAQGDHLPKAPEVNFGDRLSNAVHRSQQIAQPRGSSAFTKSHVQAGFRAAEAQVRKSQPRPTGSFNANLKSSVHLTHSGHQSGTRNANTHSFASAQGPLEEANIRSSYTPQGPYSFDYQTSSHSRSESGDENNRVQGNFAFKLDDDQSREVTYEAGSETGFVVEGDHIPVGPIVPGSPSGQPTGKLVRVSSTPFVDPLADSGSDSSYNFGFDSETYSRTETADEDGNVIGTYSVVNDDGTKVTYRFKAGKGIGFETEEVSRVQGPVPQRPTPYSGPLAADINGASPQTNGHAFGTHSTQAGHGTTSTGHAFGGHSSQAGHRASSSGHAFGTHSTQAGRGATSTGHAFGGHSSQAGHRASSSGHAFGGHSSQAGHGASSTGHAFGGHSNRAGHGTSSTSFGLTKSSSFSHTPSNQPSKVRGSFTPSSILKSAFSPSHSSQVFPGYTVHTYAHTPESEKFGYVLKFDD